MYKLEDALKKAEKEVNELVVKTLQMSFSVGFKVFPEKMTPVDFHVSKSRSLRPGETEEELLSHIAQEVMIDLEKESRKALEEVQSIKSRIYDDLSDGEG